MKGLPLNHHSPPRFARGCRTLTNDTKIAELLTHLAAAGETHSLPLFRDAAAGTLGVALVPPGHRIPHRLLRDHDRPLVVLLAGDLPTDPGPAGFPQAARLFGWARWAMIHATGGQPLHYAMPGIVAPVARRMLFVETSTARLAEWLALRQRIAPNLPGLIVQPPPDGRPHPLNTVPAGVVRQ